MKKLNALLCGVGLLALSACSDSGDDSALRTNDFNTKSCVYQIQDGGIAEFNLVNDRDLRRASFDKEYNHAHFRAVMKANIPATIDFINQTDATVYKAPKVATNQCSRNLFTMAETLPADLKARWSEAADGDGVLLGLYLPEERSAANPSLRNKAAVIVRENTNRWSLVHEFLHHLFHVRATEKGYNDRRTKERFAQIGKEISAVAKNRSLSQQEILNRVVPLYKESVQVFDTLVVNYPAEEMAIEVLMKTAYNNGDLQYVPLNSNWYIRSSAEKADEMLSNWVSLGGSIYELAYQLNDGTAMNEIYAARRVLQNRQHEIFNLKGDYPHGLSEGTHALSGEAEVADAHADCAHSKGTQEILSVTEKVKDIKF